MMFDLLFWCTVLFVGGPQVVPYQDEAGKENETEPADSTVGSHEDWKHNPVRSLVQTLYISMSELIWIFNYYFLTSFIKAYLHFIFMSCCPSRLIHL